MTKQELKSKVTKVKNYAIEHKKELVIVSTVGTLILLGRVISGKKRKAYTINKDCKDFIDDVYSIMGEHNMYVPVTMDELTNLKPSDVLAKCGNNVVIKPYGAIVFGDCVGKFT